MLRCQKKLSGIGSYCNLKLEKNYQCLYGCILVAILYNVRAYCEIFLLSFQRDIWCKG